MHLISKAFYFICFQSGSKWLYPGCHYLPCLSPQTHCSKSMSQKNRSPYPPLKLHYWLRISVLGISVLGKSVLLITQQILVQCWWNFLYDPATSTHVSQLTVKVWNHIKSLVTDLSYTIYCLSNSSPNQVLIINLIKYIRLWMERNLYLSISYFGFSVTMLPNQNRKYDNRKCNIFAIIAASLP